MYVCLSIIYMNIDEQFVFQSILNRMNEWNSQRYEIQCKELYNIDISQSWWFKSYYKIQFVLKRSQLVWDEI